MNLARIAVDVAFLGGILSISGGMYWAWPPLGLISLGLLVCGTIGVCWYRGQDAEYPKRPDAEK